MIFQDRINSYVHIRCLTLYRRKKIEKCETKLFEFARIYHTHVPEMYNFIIAMLANLNIVYRGGRRGNACVLASRRNSRKQHFFHSDFWRVCPCTISRASRGTHHNFSAFSYDFAEKMESSSHVQCIWYVNFWRFGMPWRHPDRSGRTLQDNNGGYVFMSTNEILISTRTICRRWCNVLRLFGFRFVC